MLLLMAINVDTDYIKELQVKQSLLGIMMSNNLYQHLIKNWKWVQNQCVTLSAASSNHNFDINHAIDLEKYPYEVCIQEIILQPNSWVNIITGGGKYHV